MDDINMSVTQADLDAAKKLIAALFYDAVVNHINENAVALAFAAHRKAAIEECAAWMREFIAHSGHGLANAMTAELIEDKTDDR